jgi:hypothetical protein
MRTARRRPGLALAVALGAALAAGACSPSPTTSPTPTVASSPSVPATARAIDAPCPDATWPPFDAPRPAGITAVATDRRHIEIANHSARRVYVRLSSWAMAQLETCRGIVENENMTGPLDAGQTLDADVTVAGDDPARPLTVAIWDRPCGEGCHRPPDGALLVPPSLVQPIASD